MNLSINTYTKICTNMYFQGARPLLKNSISLQKNGADTFKKVIMPQTQIK